MKYESIIASGKTIEELEQELNKKLEEYKPIVYNISSPSIFNADGKWVAVCIVEPIFR